MRIFIIAFLLNIALAQDVVFEAFARATPAKNSAVFGKIINNSSKTLVLIGAKSPASKNAEIHTTIEQNGMMKMIKINNLEIKPKSTLILAHKSHHIMLIDLNKPLNDGETIDLDLVFEDEILEVKNIPIKRQDKVLH